MKRLLFILSLVMVVAFAGPAMAQCPFYGEGYIYGQVTMYGAFGGQEGASVATSNPGFGNTITDVDGRYSLHNDYLGSCMTHNMTIYAQYAQLNGGGQANEFWAAQAPVYFRQPNQGEILYVMQNLPLWFAFYF